jgi:Na+/H+ antiporter NhaB
MSIMKALLAVLVVLVAIVIGVGFYQKWFQVSTDKGEDQKTHITVTVDQEKFKEDEKAAEKQVRALAGKVKEKTAAPVEKGPAEDPNP